MRTFAWVLAVAACGSAAAPTKIKPPISSGPPAPHPPRAPAAMIDTRPADHVVVDGDDIFVDGSGPILISRDRGKTFAPWSAGPNLCVRQFYGARGTIYAVAPICSDTDVQTHGDHFYRSTDDGATWTDLGATGAILRGVDSRDPRVVYADGGPCGHDEVCRSDDGGATWHAVVFPAASHGTVFIGDDGAIYVPVPRPAGTEIARSDDRGAHWRAAVPAPAGSDPWLGAVLADGTILASDGICDIVRSTGGHPFTITPEADACEPGHFLGGHGTTACAILADDRVIASNDGGATWLPVATPAHKDLRYGCAVADDRVLVTGGDGLLSAPVPW